MIEVNSERNGNLGGARLSSFLEQALSQKCIEHVVDELSADPKLVALFLRNYSGEVPVVLSLLEGHDLSSSRILDVGAGIGLTSFYLKREGFDVTAVEPSGMGFNLHQAIFIVLNKYFCDGRVPLLTIGAEELNVAEHGLFDVMYSSNVLEHIADLERAIVSMSATLRPGGFMIHTCPNYTFPFEPHYNIPLMPFMPAATPWAGPRKQEEVWRGLNFVTVSKLRKYMKAAGLTAHFEKGTMARSIDRLRHDHVFSSRHWKLAAIARLMHASGALSLFKHWPATLSTPLRVYAEKSAKS